MPSSLYGASDTDDDAISSIAPSSRSGYSTPSNMPEVSRVDAVPNTSYSKAQEARAESSAGRAQAEPSNACHRHPGQEQPNMELEAATPLLNAGPPPAYSDAVRQGARPDDAQQAWRRAIRYGTLDLSTFSRLQQSTAGSPHTSDPDPTLHQHAVLGAGRPPQSMTGGPALERGDGPTPPYEQDVRRPSSLRSRRRRFSQYGLVFFIILVVMVFANVLRQALTSRESLERGREDRVHPAPSSLPRHSQRPIPSPSPAPPGPSLPSPSHGIPDGPSMPGDSLSCANAAWNGPYRYQFDSIEHFELFEEEQSDDILIQGGIVRIMPAAASQETDIEISIAYGITKLWNIQELDISRTDTGLWIKQPTIQREPTAANYPCVHIDVAISIKPSVGLRDLRISTQRLGVSIHDGLFPLHNSDTHHATITNSTTISTRSGAIRSDYLSTRKTYLSTISGSITGSYALLDVLSISTRSGSINVNADPKPADESAPAPALLTAETVSGSIKVHTPTSGALPDRDYRTNIETRSGSVSGSYIFSSEARLQTVSGSVVVDLLPYYAVSRVGGGAGLARLVSDTKVGKTQLNILEPYAVSLPSAVRKTRTETLKLRSEHSTLSGSVQLTYPAAWSGVLTARSTTGSIRVYGSRLSKIEDRKGVVGGFSKWTRRLVGGRDDEVGESRMDVETRTGTIQVGFEG